MGYTYDQCVDNIYETLAVMRKFGFTPNIDKSVLIPTHIIEHLGFIINSIEMMVTITKEKYEKLSGQALHILNNTDYSIRYVSRLIGIMVACCTGVEYGELFCKQLEIEKITALRINNGDFDCTMVISKNAKADVEWWLENAMSQKRKITHGRITHVMNTDASNDGWGGGGVIDGKIANGKWNESQKALHINVLELQAVLNGLLTLCHDIHNSHIKILSDNATTVAYIRNMGGTHSLACNAIAQNIWKWAIERKNWLLCTFITGVDNVEADLASRVFDNTTEWMLNVKVFQDICAIFGRPDIDLFASKHNYQLTKYASWTPDRNSYAIDAFALNWGDFYAYCFCPFSVIPDALKKIKDAAARVIVILPFGRHKRGFPR